MVRDELDAALVKGADERLGRGGRGRDRDAEWHDEADLARVPHAARSEVIMEQQRGFAGRGRALERRRRHADDGAALRESGQHVAQPLGTGERVELIAAFEQAGSASTSTSASYARRSVVTRRAFGSMAVMVSWQNCTPDLRMLR